MTSQASSSATTHKIYLILLRRSNPFHVRGLSQPRAILWLWSQHYKGHNVKKWAGLIWAFLGPKQETFGFSTFFFSIQFIKSVAALRCDFCDFDIGCSNVPVTTKEEIVSLGPSDETKYKCFFSLKHLLIMSAHVGSRYFLSVVDNFLLLLSVVSNIFHPLSLVR